MKIIRIFNQYLFNILYGIKIITFESYQNELTIYMFKL